jgi:CHASE3 domain sensor protein
MPLEMANQLTYSQHSAVTSHEAPAKTLPVRRLLPLRVLLPLALGVIVSLGVLGFAEIGYRRLEFANKAMSAALEMETAVNETLALIGEAESGQRGFLLTGDPS